MIASDVYAQTYIEALQLALEAAPESAQRRNAAVCLEDAQWAWETYRADAAKARALRGLTHLVGSAEATRLVRVQDAILCDAEADEMRHEAAIEARMDAFYS